jgi:hypothetical protein
MVESLSVRKAQLYKVFLEDRQPPVVIEGTKAQQDDSDWVFTDFVFAKLY